ncbi:hypothetical protein CWC26_06965 [Pseudoalteromonas sp. S4488]|nr:hypothetical protein CWC26_06965 [Pseudoalteromonas sp. S4488]
MNSDRSYTLFKLLLKLPDRNYTLFLIGLLGSQITVALYYRSDYKEFFNNGAFCCVIYIAI